MGCSWANYIVRIDKHHGNFFVICPTCGQWGFIYKKSSSCCVRLGIRHRDESRCAITWNPEFSRFAENIYKTVFRNHSINIRVSIQDGEYIVDGYDYTLQCVPNNILVANIQDNCIGQKFVPLKVVE